MAKKDKSRARVEKKKTGLEELGAMFGLSPKKDTSIEEKKSGGGDRNDQNDLGSGGFGGGNRSGGGGFGGGDRSGGGGFNRNDRGGFDGGNRSGGGGFNRNDRGGFDGGNRSSSGGFGGGNRSGGGFNGGNRSGGGFNRNDRGGFDGGNRSGGGFNRNDRGGFDLGSATAPYNFVSLPNSVLAAPTDRAEKISGEINLSIEALTPLFIGSTQKTFSPSGTPIIPGSSLRGMLKNIFKVVTLGAFRGGEYFIAPSRHTSTTIERITF